MKKLESLQGNKFTGFKDCQLKKPLKILGGRMAPEATTYRNAKYTGSDVYDSETSPRRSPLHPNTAPIQGGADIDYALTSWNPR